MKIYQKVWIPDRDKNAREPRHKDEEFIMRGPAMVEKIDYDALAAELAEERRDHDNCRHNRKSNLENLTRVEADNRRLQTTLFAAQQAVLTEGIRANRFEAALHEIADFAEQFIGDDEDGDERMYKVHQIADNAIPFTLETDSERGATVCQHDLQQPNCTIKVVQHASHQSASCRVCCGQWTNPPFGVLVETKGEQG